MNANSPGVQSQPKVSPLAQHSTNGNANCSPPSAASPQTPRNGAASAAPPPPPPPPAPAMGGLAMGMPFQVLPPGGIPLKNNKQLSPPQSSSSNSVSRKSPQQQSNFEPPPLACRPEIKIPPNPMSLLKQTPRPQQKDDFWVEEYVQQKKEPSLPRDEPRRVVSPPATSPIAYQPAASPPMQQQQAQPRFVPQQRSPSPPVQQLRSVKLDEPRVASPPVAQVQPARVISPTVSMMPLTPQPESQQQTYQPTADKAAAGRIILSTMPSRLQQQQVQQHVSFC